VIEECANRAQAPTAPAAVALQDLLNVGADPNLSHRAD
jgi:hypothetical protein